MRRNSTMSRKWRTGRLSIIRSMVWNGIRDNGKISTLKKKNGFELSNVWTSSSSEEVSQLWSTGVLRDIRTPHWVITVQGPTANVFLTFVAFLYASPSSAVGPSRPTPSGHFIVNFGRILAETPFLFSQRTTLESRRTSMTSSAKKPRKTLAVSSPAVPVTTRSGSGNSD